MPEKTVTFKSALRQAETVLMGVHMNAVYYTVEVSKAAVKRSALYADAPDADPCPEHEAPAAEDEEGRIIWMLVGDRLEIG